MRLKLNQKRLDIWSSLFWLFISAFTIIHSRQYGLGNLHNPGPGFFFFWGGIFLGCFSMAVLISAIRPQKEDDIESQGRMFNSVDWRKLISALFALIAYGLFFEKLGFILSTFFLMSFLMRYIGAKKWRVAVLFALCTSLLSYALFQLWLQTQLPKGLLGI